MKFYRNPKTNEIRIVKELAPNVFVVVKLITQGSYTIKFWHGSLEKTAARWNTKPFTPTEAERKSLTEAYKSVVNKMRPYLGKV